MLKAIDAYRRLIEATGEDEELLDILKAFKNHRDEKDYLYNLGYALVDREETR